ncbi:glycoside hydrolase domain-containing protein [Desulfonema magnum]|uniref:DUF4091 n=1 Tax=Desulfonema magnum TaxID=45655 RepID=A0A975GUI5_9BACT|nr:glycoside hydrolase domain-containing protein [Desulfonema magnum]QTA93882.1 DUF4091 [Desulfonema magnum]
MFFLFFGATLAEPSAWPPDGQVIRCPVIRDTCISSVGEEKFGNNGGANKLKLKGQQEYILLDIDLNPLKGKIITGAMLHICSASPRKALLARVGVSALASEWTEGTSVGYQSQTGTSCYDQAEHKKRNWAYPGSTLMDVVFGRGHTLWKFADCTPPDQNGWQTFAIDADVIAARAAGLSHGFCLYDEVGNIWSLRKGQFKFTYFPNRFCHSKEKGSNAPWLEVWFQGTDSVPPEPVKSAKVETEGFPAGEALVRWKTPHDKGGGKSLGFHVSYKKGNTKKSLPRYLIPMAGKSGEEVRMHIQDIPFNPGEKISLTIRPVDNAGNIGNPFTKKIQLSSGSNFKFQVSSFKFPRSEELPTVGGVKVAVVDLLDKIDPKTGKMIPAQKKGYKGGNHLFSAKEKRIRLYAARNETVAFQLSLEGNAEDISVRYAFDQYPTLRPKLYQFAYVNVLSKQGKTISVLPDPLVPLKLETGNWKLETGNSNPQFQVSSFKSQLCELYVPHEASPGRKLGKVIISAGQERLELDVDLTVWNFTLPNKLSFVPEMNAYGTVSPYKGYEYYRLAHEHCTCVNRLPYAWNGVPSFAPEWKGNDFDWSEWDQKVGPLLDGSAFEDLPRTNEPVDVFYLPFSENWPVSVFNHYSSSYWADEAFTSQYEEELKQSFAAFAKHCDEKKWHDTIFQFYLNNKVYYRSGFGKSSAPWIFDEPINTQDFWALRWYGILWRLAVDPVRGNAKMWYRGDISYSQFGRNMLWGVTDAEYIGTNNAQKTRMKHDEQILWGNACFAEYGTANKIEEPNTQPVLWCLSAWAKGATGVLPWQTIGNKHCWKIADQNALFYPHARGPKPSVRLKAFTRGQQDAEYLTLLCDVYGIPRFAVVKWLKNIIRLEGRVSKTSDSDAGTLTYDSGSPAELWKLRYSVGKMLSDRGPEYKRNMAKQKTSRYIKKWPDVGYVPVSPKVEPYKPDCDSFKP